MEHQRVMVHKYTNLVHGHGGAAGPDSGGEVAKMQKTTVKISKITQNHNFL